jgi:hypothetical protein
MKCKCYGCNESIYARGLCCRCYQGLSRIVSKQGTTWETLEELGLSEPKSPIKEKQHKEPKAKNPVGRPGKFTDEEFLCARQEYRTKHPTDMITKEFLLRFLDEYSNRLTDQQKDILDANVRQSPSENTSSVV